MRLLDEHLGKARELKLFGGLKLVRLCAPRSLSMLVMKFVKVTSSSSELVKAHSFRDAIESGDEWHGSAAT